MTAADDAPALDIARERILVPAEIDDSHLTKVLSGMLGHALDAADLYFQHTVQEAWVLEDGIIREGSFNIDRGVGVRGMSGEKTGFAYSDEIILPALDQAAGAARGIARLGQTGAVQAFRATRVPALYTRESPIDSLTEDDKIRILRKADEVARAHSDVREVSATLAGTFEIMLVVASDGTLAADVRPMTRLNVSVLCERDGRRERGNSGGGGRHDYSVFVDRDLATVYAEEAVRMAHVNLESQPTPAGTMPVVLGPGWPGVLLHEAVGHGLEGDFNRKGSSTYSGRIGELVASELCTVVDDGTLEGRRGSLNVDDEGVATGKTVLIENGVLRGYMQDKLNARLMGVEPTGNGRRQSYAHMPMPRMTNTYLEPGDSAPQDIIASVDRGIYAVNFGGGSVDITSGKFVFSMTEAYLIEGGKVTAPVKGATLIGNGPEVMCRVSMVGNDLALDAGIGVCGKSGQSVPVGVGQPTVKVDEVTVGGTG